MSLRDIQTTGLCRAFGGAGVQGDTEGSSTRGGLLLLLTLAALLLELGSVFRASSGLGAWTGAWGSIIGGGVGAAGSGSGASGILGALHIVLIQFVD